jgi:hypothetical protein
MKVQKNNLFVLVFTLLVAVQTFASEFNSSKIGIKVYSTEIKIGEPLILDINLNFTTPNTNQKTGEIRITTGISSPLLSVMKEGQKDEIKHELTILNKSLTLFDYEKKGLNYIGRIVVFYDFSKKVLIFDEPGIYICRLEDNTKSVFSDVFKINVKPAEKLEQKALSILIGENDFLLLGFPENIDQHLKDFPGTIDRFKQVVEQCGDTLIAKMAAARVGIQLHYDFVDYFQNNKDDKIKQKKMSEDAVKYLEKAVELPDAFTIRSECIYYLVSDTGWFNKNYQKAISYLEEIAIKYPQETITNSANRMIKDVKTEMSKDPNWANRINEVEQPNATKPLGFGLPAASVGAVVILAVGGFLLYKKKTKSITK